MNWVIIVCHFHKVGLQKKKRCDIPVPVFSLWLRSHLLLSAASLCLVRKCWLPGCLSVLLLRWWTQCCSCSQCGSSSCPVPGSCSPSSSTRVCWAELRTSTPSTSSARRFVILGIHMSLQVGLDQSQACPLICSDIQHFYNYGNLYFYVQLAVIIIFIEKCATFGSDAAASLAVVHSVSLYVPPTALSVC